MILYKLIYRFIKYGDDMGFYLLQAQDTARWLAKEGLISPGTTVLDLGCGHGLIGVELIKRGCSVTFADEADCLLSEYDQSDYRYFNIEQDDLASLGSYDLVISSNVLEHIPCQARFIETVDRVLKPGGILYLSWTNWLSVWGGHDYSPFHYLGPRRGHLIYDRLIGGKRTHTPYVSLWPTSISGTLSMIDRNPRLRVVRMLPRYYPELAFTVRIPGLREFLTLNCLVLVERVKDMSNGQVNHAV